MKRHYFVLLVLIFLLSIPALYAAETTNSACCEVTRSGDACVFTDVSNCDKSGKIAYTSCEQTSFCQIGCCYSSDEGSCSRNTPLASCQQEPGTSFVASPSCEIAACQKGCCTVGDQAFFVTQTQCKNFGSQFPDANVNFNSGLNTEAACLESARGQEMGCCVQADSASFTTRENCNVRAAPATETAPPQTGTPEASTTPAPTPTTTPTEPQTETTQPETTTPTETAPTTETPPVETPPVTGQATAVGTNGTIGNVEGFYPGLLCSNDKLQTGCAKMHHTQCYDGKVYWYDSCGNRENIYYGENKEASYNGGAVKDPDAVCKKGEACGNCDYFSGFLCGTAPREIKPATGDLACISLDCREVQKQKFGPNADGKTKLNGEAWCSYDSQPGAGSDLPGSRHYRHVCIAGQEIIEACRDFREEICIQGVLDQDPSATRDSFLARGDFIQAACRDNRWEECSKLSTKPTCENEDLVDCYWLEGGLSNITKPLTTNVGSRSEITPPGICVPEVPPGLEHWGGEEQPVDLGKDKEKVPALSESQNPLGDAPDRDATEVCAQATRECKVTYEVGGWSNLFGGKGKCVGNCYCEKRDWVLAVSDYCQAQGDCGANYNINGKLTLDGFTIDNPKRANDVLKPEEVSKRPDCKDPKNCREPKDFKEPGFFTRLGKGGTWAGLLGIAASGVVSYGVAPAGKEGAFTEGLIAGPAALIKGLFPGGAGFGETLAVYGVETYGLEIGKAVPQNLAQAALEKSIGSEAYHTAYTKAYAETYKELSTKFTTEIGSTPLGDSIIAQKASENAAAKVLEQNGFKAGETAGTFAPTGTTPSFLADVVGAVNFLAWGYTIYSLVDVLFTDYNTYNIALTCEPWQAPRGGKDCESCNTGGLPCSEYKCRSLGQTCRLINQGTSDESCVNLAPNDANAPIITPNPAVLTKGYKINDQAGKGYEITPRVKPFTPITFGIKTNEPAQCKYDLNATVPFEQMKFNFGETQFKYNQTLAVSLPAELASGEALKITNGGTYNLYIKCQDASGNKNEADYLIRFKIDPTPDLTPPIIEATSIANGAAIAAGQSSTDFAVFLNEPVQACKYSKNDIEYDKMENTFSTCSTSGFQSASKFLSAYECDTNLNGIALGTNNFFIRCKDKAGNINDESTLITLRGSEPLEIVTTSPNSTLLNGTVTLEVETAAGADNGVAICGYTIDGGTFEFANTNAVTHTDTIDLLPGAYSIPVICSDSAGNEATSTIGFEIEKDEIPPALTQVYRNEATLFVKTDEKTTCEAGKDSFDFGTGQKMTGDNSYEHETNIESEKVVIICQDFFTNELQITVYP